MKRLARMLRRSLDLPVTLEGCITRGLITVILRIYDVSLLYGHYRQAYCALLASDWLPSNWPERP